MPLYELSAYRGGSWRCVEHQATIATMDLVDGDIDDHDALEAILEDDKPPIPSDARHLHWLAATPFRYFRALPSRFGAKGQRGVWYGAERQEVALRETAYHRSRFFNAYDGDKPHTLTMSLIQASLNAHSCLDLTSGHFDHMRSQLESDDYSLPQRIATDAKNEGAQLIIYNSARTPRGSKNRRCHAVLHPSAFGNPSIINAGRTVSLTLTDTTVRALFNASRDEIRFELNSLSL